MQNSNLKTLVSCKPTEFLRQTNRIRKSVEKWLTVTDIMNIRKRLPHMEMIPLDATQEQKLEINERNEQAKREQIRENGMAILEAIMDEHAEETLEILALCCFVDPKDVDNHTVAEYLRAFNELMNDRDVLDFFTSLVRLGQMRTVNA